MLSDYEQRTLALIEEGLATDDSRFARAFARPGTPRRRRWPARAAMSLGTLMVVVGLLAGGVPGLILQGLLIGGAGFVSSRWLAPWAATRRSRADSVQPAGPPPKSSGAI